MTDESFMSLINRLTEPHPVTLVRDSGTEYPMHEGLLQQLRAAVFSGMEGGGAGSAFGSKPPIDAGATDLLDAIDYQAAEALIALTGRPAPYGRTEDYVLEWAATVDPEKRVIVTNAATRSDETVYRERAEYTAHSLAARWVRRIEEFFNPPRVRPIQAPCPDCKTRFVARDKDGQRVQADALNIYFRADGAVDSARCSACQAEWWPGAFIDLAPRVGAAAIPELARGRRPGVAPG
jgi:uncharacterized protein with PIN domain